MDNLKLIPLTPLNLATPHTVTIGAVTIAEVADLAMASLAIRQGQEEAAAKAAANAGIALPPPGRFKRAAPFGAFWSGPQMWMVHPGRPASREVVGDAGDGPGLDGRGADQQP